VELEVPFDTPPRLGRVAGLAGLASALLLAAAFRYAHHWTPLALAIVSAWGVATPIALVTSVVTLCTEDVPKRLARVGLMLGLVSLFALVLAGLAFATGIDATGPCGGG
jgi:hypothetical protein